MWDDRRKALDDATVQIKTLRQAIASMDAALRRSSVPPGPAVEGPMDYESRMKAQKDFGAAVFGRDTKKAKDALDAGADVNAPITGGWSGLMVAAVNNDIPMIRMLLLEKANTKGLDGLPDPATIARQNRYFEAADTIDYWVR